MKTGVIKILPLGAKSPGKGFFIRRNMKKWIDDGVIRPNEYVDICPNCGGLFNPNPTGCRKRFCSDACRLAWNHKHPHTERWKDTSRTVICPVCQKEFIATREYGNLRKYCSNFSCCVSSCCLVHKQKICTAFFGINNSFTFAAIQSCNFFAKVKLLPHYSRSRFL